MTLSSAQDIFISVIIPVFNDSERLKICLDALENQSLPKERYEVIVVDNGSRECIKSAVEGFGQVSVIHEPKPGSYSARNAGIHVARGGILAFTDSDCIPSHDWLEHGLNALQHRPNCGLVAGKITLFFKNPDSPTAVELYESIELDFPQDKLLETERFGVTANLFTTKLIMNKIGEFNSQLKSGGDREWGQRVYATGYEQVYAPTALVQHPTRHTFWQLYKRVTRINGGNIDASRSSMSTLEQFKNIFNDLALAFTPPFRSLFQIWDQEERLPTNAQKIQFIRVMLFVRYVSAWERIRLRLGGKARRW